MSEHLWTCRKQSKRIISFLAKCCHAKQELCILLVCGPRPPLSTHGLTQVSLALCPNEDRLCAVTSDNQLFEVKIITQQIKDSDMRPVISLFHGPGLNAVGITGMDTCVRKPLVATCGMDRTIRVWNILEQRLDLWKAFQEEPYSLAMHPSGLHIVVGFADKIRLMNLLMDDVRTCHEISIKQCREVKFSNGGSMFAAVNGNVVTVFDFNTYDKLADLRGHNSKVMNTIARGENSCFDVHFGANGARSSRFFIRCRNTSRVYHG